jgi:translation initiation factor 5A
MDVEHSKTGKHGHMKAKLTGIDVLTFKKYEWVGPGHTNIMEFTPLKNEYSLIDIEDNTLTCIDDNGTEVFVSVDTSSEIYGKLKAETEAGKNLIVLIITAPVEQSQGNYVDHTAVDSYKEDKN